MLVLSWIRWALFPDKCLVCFEEGAVLCSAHSLKSGFKSVEVSRLSAVDEILATVNYQEVKSQQLVKNLKFSRQRSAAVPMIEALSTAIDWRLYSDYVLVPIPLHWQRGYQRGFNQSLILAQGLSAKTGLKVCRGLRRVRSTAQQARLGKQARAQNMQAAFAWAEAAAPPEKVLLIDDVVTTGATLNAAAQALKRAGSKRVIGRTFAFQPNLSAE